MFITENKQVWKNVSFVMFRRFLFRISEFKGDLFHFKYEFLNIKHGRRFIILLYTSQQKKRYKDFLQIYFHVKTKTMV
jgi:hypothetical protein